jgi:hypothetical protein
LTYSHEIPQDVAVAEAFPLADFDPEAMKREFANANKVYGGSGTPEDKAEAYIQLTTLQELARVSGVSL